MRRMDERGWLDVRLTVTARGQPGRLSCRAMLSFFAMLSYLLLLLGAPVFTSFAPS